jgi:ornithine carbamoyltransferase
MPRHLLCLSDLGEAGLVELLDAADSFQAVRGTEAHPRPLAGRSVALVFEKASTRTRISLEVAVAELGGHPLSLTSASSQVGRGEPVRDTARVLSRMVHAVTMRTTSEARLRELADFASIPVLNALTDDSHPMQLLADLQTVRRRFGTLAGLTYAWIGDGNNMANSWLEAAGLLKLELRLACPAGYEPKAKLVERARSLGATVEVLADPKRAVEGAHVVSTDVFASMGQESEAALRLSAFSGMCVTEELLKLASGNAIVLHCLPAHRGEEIEEQVLEGPRSAVWDQAGNRLHTAKAALAWALGNDG